MKDESKQSKGGKARAKSLTADQKSKSASKAAKARWAKNLPRATHTGPLRVGDIEFECAIVKSGERIQRLVTEMNFMEAMGMYRSGALSNRRVRDETGARAPLFLAHKNLKPFVEKHLDAVHFAPVKYVTETGQVAHGIPDEAIPKICEVWIDADRAGVLGSRQELIAQKADILLRAFAHIGIRALIDEATGYQYDRPRKDLEKYLEKFLAENLRKWVSTFPANYFKELCRLRGVDLRADMKLPQYFGKLTNDLVYRRIAPGLLHKLKERRSERGNQGNKLHSWLSEDRGLQELLVHLGLVIGLMKSHRDFEAFEKNLNQVAPRYSDTPGLFDDPADWEPR